MEHNLEVGGGRCTVGVYGFAWLGLHLCGFLLYWCGCLLHLVLPAVLLLLTEQGMAHL